MLNFLKKYQVFLIFLGLSLSVFSLWLLAFYPGTMSPDSTDQWYQASTLHFLDDHPYLHTLYILFFQRIFGTPLAVSVFQILITAGFFSYAFSYFWKRGVSRILIITSFALFVTSVPIGIYNITLWKDVPFSLAVLITAFIFFKAAFEKTLSKRALVLLCLTSVAAVFFRHNGLAYLLFLPILSLLFMRPGRVKFIFITVILVTSALLKLALPPLIGVKPLPSWMSGSAILQSSAGYYAYLPYTSITDKTRSLFKQFGTFEKVKQLYTPTSVNSLYFAEGVSAEIYNYTNYERFWVPLRQEFLKNTLLNLKFFMGDKTTKFFTETLGYGLLYCDSISPRTTAYYLDNFGSAGFYLNFKQTPIITSLHVGLGRLLEETKRRVGVRLLVWNSLVPFILLLLLAVDSLYRRKWPFLAYALVLLVQFPALFLLSPSDNWRYFYFYYLSLFITLPTYLLKPSVADVKLT